MFESKVLGTVKLDNAHVEVTEIQCIQCMKAIMQSPKPKRLDLETKFTAQLSYLLSVGAVYLDGPTQLEWNWNLTRHGIELFKNWQTNFTQSNDNKCPLCYMGMPTRTATHVPVMLEDGSPALMKVPINSKQMSVHNPSHPWRRKKQ